MRRLLLVLLMAFSFLSSATGSRSLDALEKYVDELPVPPHVLIAKSGAHKLTLILQQITQRLHRDLPETKEWGYQGSSPGPTIEVESGTKLSVRWKNELPSTHLLPLPKNADNISPDVRAVTHLHGSDVYDYEPLDAVHNNDGWPDAWNVAGQSQIAVYPNALSARTLWYHDHAMGTTGRNVAAGLIGLYEIHDAFERSLNLPRGRFEIPLILQARGVNPDASLFYTNDIGNEFYGNVVAVNGKLWPYVKVEPRKYRLRLLNASNARSYTLKLVDQKDKSPGPAFTQIGSDSGFLEYPVVLNDPSSAQPTRLTIAPAERMDFVVDFSKYPGQNFIMTNTSRDPGETEVEIPELMQFQVAASVSEPDTSSLPTHLRSIQRLDPEKSDRSRLIVFDQMTMSDNSTMLTLNGKSWRDPITESVHFGDTEVWQLANTLTDTHPFHIHGVEFQVLDRRLFDVEAYLQTGQINYLAPAVQPYPNEMGWKDTVRVLPQMITRIIMKFSLHPGYFIYHCHILEHEDMDMMRPYEILDH